MKKSEKFGIVFWCVTVVMVALITVAIFCLHTLDADSMLNAMKEGNIFSLYDLYDAHDWNYVVIINGTADEYEDILKNITELPPQHGLIAFMQYKYTDDMVELLTCGEVTNIETYDMADNNSVIFTRNSSAGPHDEAFMLERWETSFKIVTIDGRRYAETIRR